MSDMPPVSAVCAKGAHGFCTGTMDTCGCAECHFLCTRCFNECRRLYTGSICATCRTAEIKGTRLPRCEYPGCTSLRAYRDLRHQDDGYLCISHHAQLSHDVVGKSG